MKKLIISLLSNRFGIILAALNLCYFASRGESLLHAPFGKLFVAANSPAAISTIISGEFIEVFASQLSNSTENILGNLLFAFFIALQWLLIAEISYALAAKIRRSRVPE